MTHSGRAKQCIPITHLRYTLRTPPPPSSPCPSPPAPSTPPTLKPSEARQHTETPNGEACVGKNTTDFPRPSSSACPNQQQLYDVIHSCWTGRHTSTSDYSHFIFYRMTQTLDKARLHTGRWKRGPCTPGQGFHHERGETLHTRHGHNPSANLSPDTRAAWMMLHRHGLWLRASSQLYKQRTL